MSAKPTDVQLQKLQQFFKKKYGVILSRDELIESYNSLLSFVEAQIAYFFHALKIMIDYDLFKQVFNSSVDIPKESVKEEDANPYEVRDLSDRQKDVHLFLTNIKRLKSLLLTKF